MGPTLLFIGCLAGDLITSAPALASVADLVALCVAVAAAVPVPAPPLPADEGLGPTPAVFSALGTGWIVLSVQAVISETTKADDDIVDIVGDSASSRTEKSMGSSVGSGSGDAGLNASVASVGYIPTVWLAFPAGVSSQWASSSG